MTVCWQRYPFLRLLLPLVAGILWGNAFLPAASWLAGRPLLLLLLWAALVLVIRSSGRWLYGTLTFLLLFVLGGVLVGHRLGETKWHFESSAAAYLVTLIKKPVFKERSIQCHVACENEKQLLVYLPKEPAAAALECGDELLIYATPSLPTGNGIPGEFDYGSYLLRRGVSGVAYVGEGHWQKTGHHAARTFGQAALAARDEVVAIYRRLGFGGGNLGVLSALTVGDKEELSEEISETYSVAGASHVLALSGLHIGFLYAFFRVLFSLLWRRFGCLKPLLLLLLVAFLWGFAFFTGLSTSVVRSVVMFSMLALSELHPEKPRMLNILSAAAFFMLLCCPLWLFDVGFQLSFSAVGALLLIQPRLYALWTPQSRFLQKGWSLATVSIAAQIGTAPIVMLYFSRFSTHFLLTNLWVVPLVSLIIYAAVLLLALTPFPLLQEAWARVVNGLVELQNQTLRCIEELPLASIDGIWLPLWGVVLFYLFLLAAYRSCCMRTGRSYGYVLTLSLLLLLVGGYSVSAVTNSSQPGIAFYNIRGCPAVHCLTSGSGSWLVCADSLPHTKRMQRTLSHYWNRMHIDIPATVTGDFLTTHLAVSNHIVTYGGKRICLLHDHRWRNKQSAQPLPIDYLYVSQGYNGSVAELLPLFAIKQVILDASLAAYVQQRIGKECLQLGISCRRMQEEGVIFEALPNRHKAYEWLL